MYQEERLYEILNILREKTVLSNKEIMDTFNISRILLEETLLD